MWHIILSFLILTVSCCRRYLRSSFLLPRLPLHHADLISLIWLRFDSLCSSCFLFPSFITLSESSVTARPVTHHLLKWDDGTDSVVSQQPEDLDQIVLGVDFWSQVSLQVHSISSSHCLLHVSGAEAAGFVRGAESSQLLFTPNSISCSNQISSEVLKHAVQTEKYRHGYVRQQQGYVLKSEGFLLSRVEKIITELKRLLSVPLCPAPSLQTADISVSQYLWI